MEAMYPEEETIDSRQGTAAHWAAAQMLKGYTVNARDVADNGEPLNIEMLEAAQGYADHIKARDFHAAMENDSHVEQIVASAALHPDNWGTPDYWLYDERNNHLCVDDFKYGHGFVSEIRNRQMVNYAALIAEQLGAFRDDSLRVTMTIHQPRNYHWRGPVRSWSCSLGDLRYDFLSLASAFAMAMADDAPTIARNPEACRNCSARFDCEANLMATGPAIDLAYSTTPLRMSNAAMRKEYQALVRAEKMIKARREGIEQNIKTKLERGGVVPGFYIAHRKGRATWKDDAIEHGVIDVANAMGVNIEKAGMITPLQAEKAGLPADVIKLYSHSPGGAAELVADDGTTAANIFSK